MSEEKLGRVSKEKLEALGIKDNKYEITLKFNEADVFLIAAVLLVAPQFGYKEPEEFIKFILHQFNRTIADMVMGGGARDPDGKKETLH